MNKSSSIMYILIGVVVITLAIFGVIKYKSSALIISNIEPVLIEEVSVIEEESKAEEPKAIEGPEIVKEVCEQQSSEIIYKEIIKEIIKEVPVVVSGLCPQSELDSKLFFFNIPVFQDSSVESTPGLDPHLVIHSLNFYPLRPVEGDTVTFWAIVQNQGEGNKVDSSAVHLSIDRNFWDETIIAGLVSNRAGNIVWNKKWKAVSGKHMLEACIENNCIETNFTIRKTQALPDYVISSASIIPNNPVFGDILSFSATVRNQGNISGTGLSFVRLRIDIGNDGKWDILAGNNTVDILAPVGSEKEIFRHVWAATKGTHRYEICADDDSMINELDETNNCKIVRFVIK